MEKIDQLKVVPTIGETYLVPCFIVWPIGTRLGPRVTDRLTICPIYNQPHNDKENGQEYVHWHSDHRFVGKDNEDKYEFNDLSGRPGQNVNNCESQKFQYLPLKYLTHNERFQTENKYIAKSALPQMCKGSKCPHRGFDLRQVPLQSIYGRMMKVCPLHSTIIEQGGRVMTEQLMQEAKEQHEITVNGMVDSRTFN